MASPKLTSGRRESLAPPSDSAYPPNVRVVDPSKVQEPSRRHRRQRDLNMKTEETQQAEQRRSLAHALEFLDTWKVEHSADKNDKQSIERSKKKYDACSSSSQIFLIPTKTNIEHLSSDKYPESDRMKSKDNMNKAKKRSA